MLYEESGRLATAQAICDDYGTDGADQLYRLSDRAVDCNDYEALYWCEKILKQIAYNLGERLLKEIQTRPKLPSWDTGLGADELLDSLCAWSLIHNNRLNEASNQFHGLDDTIRCVRQSWTHPADCAGAQSEDDSATTSAVQCLCGAREAWENVDRVIFGGLSPDLPTPGRNMRVSMYEYDYIGQQVLTSAIMSNLGYPSYLVELHDLHERELEQQEPERMYETAVVTGEIDDDPSKLLYICSTWHHYAATKSHVLQVLSCNVSRPGRWR